MADGDLQTRCAFVHPSWYMCLEWLHLQETTVRLRERLNDKTAAHAQASNVIPIRAEERAIRVALFSAEIDLAYHRARCLQCGTQAEEAATEELIAA